MLAIGADNLRRCRDLSGGFSGGGRLLVGQLGGTLVSLKHSETTLCDVVSYTDTT